MVFEHKENTGSLWPPREGAPEGTKYSGEINVEGTNYWITLWDKRDADQKFWRLTVKAKGKRLQEAKPPPPESSQIEIDDEIPF